MSGVDRREGARRGARVRVAIEAGGEVERCETRDVTRRGAFLLSWEPRPQMSLVSLRIELPSGPIAVKAMVAREVPPQKASTRGVSPGMGVLFYGLDDASRIRWEAFVDGLGLAGEPSVEDSPVGHPVFRIVPRSLPELLEFRDRALRSGGVFVKTNDLQPIDASAVVVVVHPERGDELHLSGEIVPTSRCAHGVAVRFAQVTERTIEDFTRFIERAPVGVYRVDGALQELSATYGPEEAEAENTAVVSGDDVTPFDEP